MDLNLFDGLFDDSKDGNDTAAVHHKPLDEMSEEERKAFMDSKDYQEYSVINREEAQAEANMQGRNTREVLGLSNTRERVSYSFNSIKCIQVDLDIYEDIFNQSTIMQETVAKGNEILPTFEYLYQDIFLSLIKYTPEIVPDTEIHTSVLMNRSILKKLINTPEFIKLRKACRLDSFTAACGTEVIGKKAIELLKVLIDKIKDLKQKQDAMDELMEKERELDELVALNDEIDDMLDELEREGLEDSQQARQLLDQRNANEQAMSVTKQIANQIAQSCDELLEEESDEIETFVREMGHVMDEASYTANEVSQLCNAWGFGTGNNSRVDFKSKKAAVENIRRSRKLLPLTDKIGRFKESAINEQKKKAKDGATELRTVTTGDKIQDTLPSERINLAMQVTKADFYRRYSEKQLLVYSKDAHKRKNKGPIIVCVDTSGSMEGDAETWSKAMTIALMEVAELQKRDFACIIYSSHADEPIVIKKDEIAPEKIIKVAEKFYGGGTDFVPPLERAMKLINESRFKDADIVFITDGDCGIPDNFLAKYKAVKREKEFLTLGIVIDLGFGHCSRRTMDEICDEVIKISDVAQLNDPNSDLNRNIFASL